MSRPDFESLILKANADFCFDGPPESAFLEKLKHFKQVIKAWAKSNKLKEEEQELMIIQEMENIDKAMEERTLTEEEEWILGECKANLADLESHKMKDLWQKSRATWASHGDDNSRSAILPELSSASMIIKCNSGSLPFKYLGLTVGANMNRGDQVDWKWRWKRQPSSTTELQQLQLCNNNLSQIQPSNRKDDWIWIKDDSGSFTVASMRELLQDHNTYSNQTIQWNNWVPAKVNVFGWRAVKERIATRTALRSRGIPLESTLCPLCGDHEETTTHLFTSCYIANMVWHSISSWCKIPPIFVFSVRDIFEIHNSINTTKEKRKIFQAIILTACWSLWKTRNEKIFENKNTNLAKLLQDIKSLGYTWVKNRSSFRSLIWKDWCSMDLENKNRPDIDKNEHVTVLRSSFPCVKISYLGSLSLSKTISFLLFSQRKKDR
ncbi:hypothetical protein QVD17_03514 [Tagetes erecta]|uniref:Reverse transcriptase zinc-binding domain-containing protein n=1 Tax=Tagetes erecta TaxID=13708 RepID=A0AAD8P8R2_TARER|nr:hypothetical protein QVD17_03514 [Tagetes erecta]